ncbi:MAG: hypothetical protein Q7S05_01605 [bacterium]|nr:hypothetical protein [bacterium]
MGRSEDMTPDGLKELSSSGSFISPFWLKIDRRKKLGILGVGLLKEMSMKRKPTFYPVSGNALQFEAPEQSNLGKIIEELSKIQGVPPTGVRVFIEGLQIQHSGENEQIVPHGWANVVLMQDCTQDWSRWKSWRIQAA